MISSPRRSAPARGVRLARTLAASRRSASYSDMGGLFPIPRRLKEINRPRPGVLLTAASAMVRASRTPARNTPMTSSLTPSIARAHRRTRCQPIPPHRLVASTAMLPPRQTLTRPMR